MKYKILFFLRSVKEFFQYILFLIMEIIKRIFGTVIEWIIEFILMTLDTARCVLYKVVCVVLRFTTIGFWGGVFLLYLNIKQAMTGINFTDTNYFSGMIFLWLLHIGTFIICKILCPDYD